MTRALVATFSTLPGLLLAGCGSDSPSPVDPGSPTPATVAIAAGNQQQADAGAAVATPPAVRVADDQGRPVPGVSVQFSVTAGGGQLQGGNVSTDAAGVARVTSWTLGPIGEQRLSAKAGSLPPVDFSATITPGTEQFVTTVGPAGGILNIGDSANPFHGLTLAVPAGTVSESTEWRLRVASQPPDVSLPAGFAIVGPALEISTNQARGSRLMTLEVPVRSAPDMVTFLALYDPLRDVIELMPTVSRTDSTIVVVATHLRRDLLPGSVPPAASPASNLRASLEGTPGIAPDGMEAVVLLALEHQKEFLENLVDYAEALNRWPVVDHGTTAFPDGLGAGIAALQAAGSTGDYPDFGDLVRELSIPGFYAEAGPLSAVQMAQKRLGDALGQTISELASKLGQLPKPQRDELMVQDLLAGMRLNGRAGIIAGIANNRVVAAAVTAGSAESLTLQSPAEPEPTTVTVSLGGFGTLTLPLVAGGEPHTVSDVVPLSSFVLPYEQLQRPLALLRKLTQSLAGPERDAINAELAAEADLPMIPLEVQHVPGGDWLPAATDRIIAHSQATRVRILGKSITFHLPTGAEMFRTDDGAPAAVEGDLGLDFEGPREIARRAVSMLSTLAGGALRQTSVAQVEFLPAPFEVEPAQVTLDADDLTVDFMASVPSPPDGGFRIGWDWGDGETSENLGLLNASHEYGRVDDYVVVATLMTSEERHELAVDTVRVRGKRPSAWIGTATQTVSTINELAGLTYAYEFEGEGLRFELSDSSMASTVQYDLVEGTVRGWVDITNPEGPGCKWVGAPPVTVAVGTGALFFWDDAADIPPGVAALYRAYGESALTIVHRYECEGVVQSTESLPFTSFLRTADEREGPVWRQTTDPVLLEGAATQSTTLASGSVITYTWTWRLEPVYED